MRASLAILGLALLSVGPGLIGGCVTWRPRERGYVLMPTHGDRAPLTGQAVTPLERVRFEDRVFRLETPGSGTATAGAQAP